MKQFRNDKSRNVVSNNPTPYALRPTPTIISLIGSVLILTALFLLQAGSLQAAPPAQAPDSPPSVAGGRALWTENCVPCHGPTGRGDGPTAQSIENPIASFQDPTVYRTRTPAETFDVIKNGRIERLMPPWQNRFDDAQMWDLTAYVWSLHTTADSLAAGAEVYVAQCAACHGIDGTGDTTDNLSSTLDFTDLQATAQQSLADWQVGFTESSAHAQLDALSEEELWLALDHVRTFSFALPQRNGVLTGQVINGTNNRPEGSIDITLYMFRGQTDVETLTTQADSEGNYTFENLLTDPELLYIVEGSYGDVSYVTEPRPFSPDSTRQTLDLNVYETTDNDEAVRLSQMSNLISFAPDSLRFVQLFILSNEGSQTYTGENGQTFAFALPEEATNVTFQNDVDNRFIETDTGYVTNEPIIPGDEGLVVAAVYDVPIQGETLTVDIPVPADVEMANLLVQSQPGIELNSQQLQFIETRQLENNEFATYAASSLTQGDTLTLEFSGLDTFTQDASPENVPPGAVITPPSVIDQTMLRWIIIGFGGLVVLLVGVLYPYLRPRLTPARIENDLDTRRRRLLLLLARLDDAHDAGEINAEIYRQARTQYKNELLSLME